jgi:hypothetical protein
MGIPSHVATSQAIAVVAGIHPLKAQIKDLETPCYLCVHL